MKIILLFSPILVLKVSISIIKKYYIDNYREKNIANWFAPNIKNVNFSIF